MSNKENGLVQIGRVEETTEVSTLSRRKFLKILGASSAVGVAGCAQDHAQNVLPYVKGEADQIPGVAVWYRSTCRECSAGCGIQVRTREGRTVKIEGNRDHPINHGGLCGLGQAALQALYDPDRVRQPLMRDGTVQGEPVFKPISWEQAFAKVGAALSATKGKKVLITGEETGTLAFLIEEWAKASSVEHVTFDAMQPVALAKASELVYGSFGIPGFAFDKAEVVLNFGADFLETWISPCEYARGWAQTRKSSRPARVIHIEPRLSLTGANADMWLSAKPGTEVRIAMAVLKSLLGSGAGAGLREDIRETLAGIVKGVTVEAVSAETGVPVEKIVLCSHYLNEAKSSLVIAGGTAASSSEALELQTLVAFINLVLGNVGKTVNLAKMRKPKTSVSKLASAISSMKSGDVGLVLIHGTNPQFNLSSEYGLNVALNAVRSGGPKGKPGLVVSFSSTLDETAQLADVILPANHSLEDWGDDRSVPGVYSLLQPTMTPVFDTKSLGDMLMQLASSAGQSGVLDGAEDYAAYLKSSWKRLHATLGVKQDFARFWLECCERGGYFDTAGWTERFKVAVDSKSLQLKFKNANFAASGKNSNSELVLFPYPSVKSFDGRAANRPWLQELPDPITSYVWDAWAELHPETAKKIGVEQGDLLTLRTSNGELNLPVSITEYVHRDIVAVPMGQGHVAYGRFAKKVGAGGNVFGMLPSRPAGDGLNLLGAKVEAIRGRGRIELIKTQGSDSQFGREIAKTSFVGAAAAANAHHEHHEPKQMYKQREHPLYEWVMSVDLAACTGCGACVVACYAENNIAVVGREACGYGREMSWLRIDRYFEGPAEELQVSFQPMMCQHCHNAPCEPVCPVYATYHNEEGLNVMAYNRCVGTRYCSNNCSYKVRRFNFFEYNMSSPLEWQLNPDVTKRSMGVMEKCTFCIQRINEGKDRAKDEGRLVKDGEIQPACVQSCPTEALAFGNANDKNSVVSRLSRNHRSYKVLDHHINTQPAVSYLERVKYKV